MLKPLIIGVILAAWSVQAVGATSYHVGNSLTNDSRPNWMDDFAAQIGLPAHTAGWHIRSGSSLEYIWNNPSDVTLAGPSGTFDVALPGNTWDTVTLQAYNTNGATLGGEAAAALNYINLTRSNSNNSGTVFYILASWPTTNEIANWEQSIVDDDSTPAVRARQTYELILSRVRAQTVADVFIIPTGEVIYQLSLRIANGEVPGYSSIDELYRDATHLSLDVGRYVAATTMFSTMYRMDPTGLTIPPDPAIPAGTTPPSPALYAVLNETVWNVVSGYDYSGVPEPASLAVIALGLTLLLRRECREQSV